MIATAVLPSTAVAARRDRIAPTTPTSLTVTAATGTSLSLSWKPSTDNRLVKGYDLFRDGVKVGTSAGTSYTFAGLACGRAYTLGVRAYDAAGNRSAVATVVASTSACPDTSPPSTPANLAQTGATGTSIVLSWTRSLDDVGVAGYGLYRDGVKVGSTLTTTFFSYSGLACGTSYTLAVDAYDWAGNRSAMAAVAASTSICPDTTPPSVPQNLTKTGASQTGISLSWGVSTDDVGVAGYSVYSNGSKVADTPGTSYTVGALACGTSYTLAVDAYDAAGNRSAKASLGAPTTACAGSTPSDTTPPSTPGVVTKTGATETSISLSWTASTDNVGVAGYGVYRDGTRVATPTTTSYTFGGLNCGTSYTLAVDAYDAAGNRSARTPLAAQSSACTVVSSSGSSGWLVKCQVSHSLPDDPIVYPGVAGASHLHDFFGNQATNAFSTYSFMTSATTLCREPGDTGGYWAPSLYKNGVKVVPGGIFSGTTVREQFYYRKTGTASVTPFPADFRMIAGDSKATSTYKLSEVYWGCSDNSNSSKQPLPIDCSTGIITLHVGFPSCWNGWQLDTPDHKSHVAYPSSGACPSTHPVRVPRLIERFEYPVGTSSSGITLSSGSPYTAHADFWNTWDQARLEQLTADCLNKNVDCGTLG
jgi:chitodextrinase